MNEITASQKTALLKLPGFKDIQKQYAKETKMAGGGKKRMKGRGFWDDVGAWFVQAGKDVNQFLKDTKIVSNIAAYALPILGAMGGALLTVNPLGATAGGIAGKSAADYIRSQGYGKMKGKGLHDIIDTFAYLSGNPSLTLANAGIAQVDKLKNAINASKAQKMKGGELSNKLVINPVGQRLMGKGEDYRLTTRGFNGVAQTSVAPSNSGIMRNMKGNGLAKTYMKTGVEKQSYMQGCGGVPFGSISSEFGNVRFA